ncbi:putative bifunctional diguanylate cyclase/phosphodiesterase [Exiguobacterium antarcticum]|uniref:putative bifunctional diguanylate cyclase/phosphodiesterase n=1 Tax=Exiguobacterium antarcticum TaxID=132920 RepID=UPI000D787B6C|nr:EAL domain-containing protein [Exiguobacterium antarcticum]
MPFFKRKNTESFINGSLDFKQLVDATHFLENHPDAVYTLNLDGQIVSYNQKLSLLLGYGGKQLQHQHFSDFISLAEAQRIAPLKQRALSGETIHFTADVLHREGHVLTMNVTNIPIYQHHVIIGIYGIARDISQHLQLRLHHTRLSAKEQLTASLPGLAFFEYETTADRLSLSTHFATLLDVSHHRLASLDYDEFLLEIHPDDRSVFEEQLTLLQKEGSSTVSCHLRMNQKQHYTRQIQCQGVRVEDERQELFSFLFRETARHTPLGGTKKTDRSQQDDVPDSTLMQQQEDIRKLSLYDHVTGLPNRMLFLEEIEHLTRKKHPFTILSLDFNQLHQINEQIGFDIGDQWLRQTSQFLTEQLPDMYCSRLAGDHYAALWTEPFDELQLKKTCLDLLSVNTTRFQIEGYELAAELAIGISPFQTEETTATELLHTANRALSRAKLKPQPAYEFYTSQLDLEIYRRHQLEQSLRNAIEQKELFLEYQPKVDIWSGQILTCEALIRWDHPEWGRIPPQDFIPLSEEGHCYLPIGEWVLETVCQTLQSLLHNALPVVPISINLSSKQLLHRDFVQTIRTCLHRYQVPARYLQLELQETALLQESEFIKETLQQLHQLGIELTLDGYGSGVSSLNSLRTYPISSLKLDRSFVAQLEEDNSPAPLIKSIVYLAKEFQLTVVAEGIETLEQLDQFREFECHAVQGYLFSRPVGIEQLPVVLKQAVLVPMESMKKSPKKPLPSLHGHISITRLNGKDVNVGSSPILITRSTNRSVHFYASIRLPVNHQIELSLQLTDVVHPKTLIEPLALTELDNGLFHYSADYKIRAQSSQIMKALETSQQLKLDEFFMLS